MFYYFKITTKIYLNNRLKYSTNKIVTLKKEDFFIQIYMVKFFIHFKR